MVIKVQLDGAQQQCIHGSVQYLCETYVFSIWVNILLLSTLYQPYNEFSLNMLTSQNFYLSQNIWNIVPVNNIMINNNS